MIPAMKRYYLLLLIGSLVIGGCASTLRESASRGDLAEVNKLIIDGKDVNARDDEGRTPIYYALQNNHEDVVETLIDQGAELDLRDNFGQTPLTPAVVYGSPELAEFLIINGAEVNAVDRLGCTPLHEAARKGRVEMLELLLWSGAQVNARNNIGWTPLDVAVTQKQNEAAKLLLSKGGSGYSYEVRRYLLAEDKRREGPGGRSVSLPGMKGVIKEVYDSFNEKTALSVTFSIEPFRSYRLADRYRLILSDYAKQPRKLYHLSKEEWLIGPWNTISLSATGDTFPTAELTFIFQSPVFYFFSHQPAQVKIGEKIYHAELRETTSNAEEEMVSTRAVYRIGKELVSEIKEASSVIIRVPFDNKPPLTWQVPAAVLENWKEFFKRAEDLFR